MKRAINCICPYLTDKSSWPYSKDVEHFDSLPVKASFLLLAGLAYHHEGLLRKWRELPFIANCQDPEMIRNVAVKQSILWLSIN